MKMRLEDALNKLNQLGKKMNTTGGLTEDENVMFNNLSEALDKFELPSNGHKASGGFYNGKSEIKAGPTGQMFRTPSGHIIQAYKQSDKLCEAKLEEQEAGWHIRNMLLGSDKQLPGFNKIKNTHGSDPTGVSLTVPSLVSSQLWDIARSKSVAMSCGVQSIPLSTGSLSLIRTLNDITPTWRGLASNAWHDVNVTNPSYEAVTLQLKSVACLSTLSLELLEDSAMAAKFIEQTITSAIASAVDKAVFIGAGGSEPTGITNTANVQAQLSVGSLSDYSEHLQAIGDVMNANCPLEPSQMVWVTHPRVRQALMSLTSSSTDEYIQPPPWINDLKKYTTTTMVTVSDSPDTYLSLVGDVSQVILGLRPNGITFEMLNAGSGLVDGSGNTYNLTSGLGVALRCWTRMDVAVLRPTHIAVLSGISV